MYPNCVKRFANSPVMQARMATKIPVCCPAQDSEPECCPMIHLYRAGYNRKAPPKLRPGLESVAKHDSGVASVGETA